MGMGLMLAAGMGLAAADFSQVPGVVIDHLPAGTGLFVGSPSIAIWTNGDYVVSHDFFGPKSIFSARIKIMVTS